jgi:hypothetical protein
MELAQLRAKVNAAGSVAGDVKLRQYCQRRRAALLELRAQWISDWQTVAEYVDPTRGQFTETGTTQERGNKKSRKKILNGTATRCVRVAVAGMSSHMTSKSRPWFQLAAPDPALGERHDVKVWLEDVTTIIRDVLAKSNFYKAMPVVYTEDMEFGVAAMLTPANDEEVIRFHPLTIGSYAIGVDKDGRVDTLWRSFRKTARQLEQKYGRDNLPENVRKALGPIGQPGPGIDQVFVVEALIERNPDEMPGIGPMRMQAKEHRPWREVVWIQGGNRDAHGCLDIGGHYEAPFVTVRWNPVGDDVYSDSPMLDSLGDIKQLQYLEGQKLRLLDLHAEPPLGIPEAMRNLGASLSPRTKTYVPNTAGAVKAEALYSPDPRAMDFTMGEIREKESKIEEAAFYNLFLMMESLGEAAGRTATEIAERREEKAAVLGPTLESVTDEALDPIVIRVYALADRQGLIPPAPEALDGIPLKIEYTSILAQAMKAAGTSGIERSAGFIGNLAQAFPDILDNFDADVAANEYNERVGGPAGMMRSADAVAAIRGARAKQQQQQMALAAAAPIKDAATAVKTLGEAVPQDGSLGQGLADQMAGMVPA